MSRSHPQRLVLAVEPFLMASMLQRALKTEFGDVVMLEAGSTNVSGEFDVVVASGRVPQGVRSRASIRLPAPYASSTVGVVRRHGAVEIVQIPTLRSLFDLIDTMLADQM